MIIAATTIIGLTGCFNLDEKVYSIITEDTFNASEEDLIALMGSSYVPLQYIMSWQGLFDAQEEPGDAIITPVRPDGWDDGGTYQRMHKHTWTNLEYQHTNTYATCFDAICKANKVMDQINAGKYKMDEASKNATIDELRSVRALWYSILLDTHGNVPLVTHFTDSIPGYSTRQQIYDFVVSELTDVLKNEHLSKTSGTIEYGRLNHWGTMMTLMRVYLNAGVYTGTPQWTKALECAEAIIDSKVYTLSGNYSDNFKVDLDASNTEVIFAVPYSGTHYETFTFCMHAKWYPPSSNDHFGWKYQCWDGSCANPQFINSYDVNDPRLAKTWLMGPQMAKDDPKRLVWTCLNYLPSLTSKDDNGNSMTSSDYGYRVNKFEQDTKTSFYWNNDFPYYRLAEAYLAKAECLLRLGIREDEALAAVNAVRQRNVDPAPAVTLADLKGDTKIKYGLVGWGSLTKAQYDGVINNSISWSDLPGLEHSQTVTQSGDDATPIYLGGLYDEWGWEFACEAQRRTEMIRFGTFSTRNWFNHTAITDGHTSIFPIPEDELNANSNLKQNPGY